MDKDTIIKYAPWLIVCLLFFLQYNLFVTPAQLEVKHREIMVDVANRYTTKEQFNDVKAQLGDIQKKIDKIYEKIIK